MSPIAITTVTGRGTSKVRRVTVAGEIDDSTAPALQEALARAIGDDSSRLELDLTDVTFFSCAGLTALVGARHAAGSRLDLIGAGRQVRRVLQILNLDAAFGPDTAAEALRLPVTHLPGRTIPAEVHRLLDHGTAESADTHRSHPTVPVAPEDVDEADRDHVPIDDGKQRFPSGGGLVEVMR
ncbi:STAS domain-containing protein [Dactylosporangium cerinum]|uniref:STAS domain-containing protein n=1 Tax=Dactylosporangium cerinum TaxID=1434730 RepID=A0ABV9VNT0_9ACTN